MAIYRNDQARLSIAAEAGLGGYLDIALGGDSGTGGSTLSTAASPGDRSVTLVSSAGYAADEYIQIEADADPVREVRRIKRVTGNVIYFDYPLAYPHASAVACNEVAAAFSGSSFITFLPGVYETVTLPDIAPEFAPQYFLGTSSNRNPSITYRGRQSFVGSLPNVILLNGFPLRFPIGRVTTTGTDVGGGGGSTLSAAASKGAREISVTDGTSYSNNDFIQIDTGTSAEVRQISSGASGAGAQVFVLDYPLMIAHSNGATLNEVTSPYTHTVRETVGLDSMTWHVLMRDTDEAAGSDFIRRYVGGKANRSTLLADEGGVLRMSFDDVQFIDLVHNQRFHSSVGGGTTEIVRYNGAIIAPTVTLPTTEPYYFSQGSVSLFGVTFARIRNFRLETVNNVTPEFYITDNASERIAQQMFEARRAYRLAATIALPDSLANTATTRTLFKELILEGNYGTTFSGFDVSLVFTRGTNDTITITIPPSSAAAGLDAQGAFIERAPSDITAENLVQAEVSMIFRSVQMTVVDSVGTYP